MKGLREVDRAEFRHLVFESGYLRFWKSIGMPSAKS